MLVCGYGDVEIENIIAVSAKRFRCAEVLLETFQTETSSLLSPNASDTWKCCSSHVSQEASGFHKEAQLEFRTLLFVHRRAPVGLFETNSSCISAAHVEEHGAKGWRDCVQRCSSHTGYMLHGSLDWFRDYGVGFFTTSLTSYIERLRSSTLTEQIISEDVSPQYARTSMPGRRRYAWRVFSRRHILAVPAGSLTHAMTEDQTCVHP